MFAHLKWQHKAVIEYTYDSICIFRCGRTGRVGSVKDCRVDNFISTPSEIAVVQKIERAVRKMKPIPIFDIHDKEKGEEFYEPFEMKNEIETQQEFSIPY